ncbi:MAG: hypothetical protein JJE53_01930 [Candidatus Pacebacteria bacterium]|nr:hypothetical protein [Candidatus Paceibacterota bacterium]
MRTYIKKLQSKSEDTRKQILLGAMIVSMSLVAVIYIGSFSNNFNEEKSLQAKEDIKPFSLFSKSISETYNNISASVGNITQEKEKIEESIKKETEKQIDLIPVETEFQ